MAHFAQLDENNIVTQVIVVNNAELKDTQYNDVGGFIIGEAVESEAKGIAFLHTLFPADTVWKQTSYNASFRGKFAAIGDTFNGTDFVSPVVPPVEGLVTDGPIDLTLTNTPVEITIATGTTGSDTIGV